jgi:protein CpxP
MRRTLRMPAIGAMLVAGLAVPFFAHAQSPTPSPDPSLSSTAPSPAIGNPTTDERIDKRLARLHTALQITADEEPQWRQFAEIMRENAHKTDQDHDDRQSKVPSIGALENMQSTAQFFQDRADNLKRLAAAFEPLYAAMPEAQKHIADQVLGKQAPKQNQK